MAKRDPEPRMLTQQQAALYCGIGVKTFKDACPVQPTTIRDGLHRYDRCKIDAWLDSLAYGVLARDPIEWLNQFDASLQKSQ